MGAAAMKSRWTAILTAGRSSAALADEVLLTNGRTLVGIAHEQSGRVVVETRWGDLGFPKEEVRSITPGRCSIHEYQERLAKLDECASASEAYELALWA